MLKLFNLIKLWETIKVIAAVVMNLGLVDLKSSERSNRLATHAKKSTDVTEYSDSKDHCQRKDFTKYV